MFCEFLITPLKIFLQLAGRNIEGISLICSCCGFIEEHLQYGARNKLSEQVVVCVISKGCVYWNYDPPLYKLSTSKNTIPEKYETCQSKSTHCAEMQPQLYIIPFIIKFYILVSGKIRA